MAKKTKNKGENVQTEKKRDVGRPTDYEPKYHVPWAQSLAMEGLSATEIAKRMGIARSTLLKWKAEHKEFSDAILKGREVADADVERSLYEKALGYTAKEKKVIVTMDESGNQKPARIETTEKHIPADVAAMIFWLKNRQPEKWRDRIEQAIDTGDKPQTVQIYLPDNGRDNK